MATYRAATTTDGHRDALVVFLIGMRVNRWSRPRAWWPVLMAMPRMLRELSEQKHRGLLGYQMMLGRSGPVVVQYWRGVDELLAYAHGADGAHRPAWRAFNRRACSAAGAVGIWHETYQISAGAHESFYSAMPPIGLAAATSSVPVSRRGTTARARLGAVA